MPEAEISPAGDVLVEGHHVGELQGFRFTADRSAEGEDAKAVKAAAQKALVAEFDARAERFAAAPNGDLALGSDGTLRWLGAPVGTLVASDDALRPRVVLLADEQLTGTPRDRVAARAERFVAFQVDTMLKPLVDLRRADHLTGIARGLAFQLVENFGLLNRRDISEDVRSLDQEARGALRRLGVRFGAYHVFVPSLLKPAPAGLATLLWALKHDAKDKPGYGDVIGALAAGRTSVVTDSSFERSFYRLAGFRHLGGRAVRVDILERLADLIRPALAWKPGTGPRADGAYDGNAFIVTPAMMSILGATSEDMEAILKGLGYRSEAKPAAEVTAHIETLDAAAAASAEANPTETAAGTETSEAGTGDASNAPAAEAAQPDDATPEVPAPEVAETQPPAPGAGTTPQAPETAETEQPAAEASPKEVSRPAEELAPPAGVAPRADSEGEAAKPGPDEEEEPKAVLVWRPARSDGRGRHRGRQDGRNERQRGRRVGDSRHESKGKGKRQRPADGGKLAGKGDSANRPRRDERPPKVDPDSPFAKLAALKDQLSR